MHRHLYILPALLLLASACSNDDIEGGSSNHAKARITLSLQTADHTAATRSNSYNVTGDLIHNAYVVMADPNGKVAHIYNVLPETSATEFERKQVAAIDASETGNYTFYSFANLPFTASGYDDTEGDYSSLTVNGVTFTKNSTVPSGLADLTYDAAFTGYTVPADGIAMTNCETFTVNEDVTVTLSLYRMLGKMQFTFNNITDLPVRIKKVTVGDITANTTASAPSTLYFLPRKNANNIVETSFPTAHTTTDAHTLFDYGTDIADAVTISGNSSATLGSTAAFGSVSAPLYINESVPVAPHQGFPLTIEMDRQNEEGSWETDTREAVVQLSEIDRNSVALVNVNLSRYVVKLNANSYPPIGAYPPVLVEENGEFYVTFTGGGDFEIVPSMYEFKYRNNPENWFSLNDTRYVQSYRLSSIDDPSGIFSAKPAFDATTGEILGTIKDGASGTATLKLQVTLITSPTGTTPVTTQTYTRTIYIIAQ